MADSALYEELEEKYQNLSIELQNSQVETESLKTNFQTDLDEANQQIEYWREKHNVVVENMEELNQQVADLSSQAVQAVQDIKAAAQQSNEALTEEWNLKHNATLEHVKALEDEKGALEAQVLDGKNVIKELNDGLNEVNSAMLRQQTQQKEHLEKIQTLESQVVKLSAEAVTSQELIQKLQHDHDVAVQTSSQASIRADALNQQVVELSNEAVRAVQVIQEASNKAEKEHERKTKKISALLREEKRNNNKLKQINMSCVGEAFETKQLDTSRRLELSKLKLKNAELMEELEAFKSMSSTSDQTGTSESQ